VDDLFLDEDDRPEYVGVKMGFLGLKSTLIPMEIVTVDESSRSLTVSQEKGAVKDAPTFDDDNEITPEFEEQVYSYYGLTRQGGYAERGSYGAYSYGEETTTTESSASTTGATTGSADLQDEGELRVQRSEEELVAGTREREAGRVGVRKRVRTDRERIAVPKRREEVHVDRVPVEGRVASEAEIGEDEVVMPVTEEEVVVSKRPVVKEEVRISTDVVEEEEIVEEDVRREEVEVIDETERGRLRDDETRGGRGLWRDSLVRNPERIQGLAECEAPPGRECPGAYRRDKPFFRWRYSSEVGTDGGAGA